MLIFFYLLTCSVQWLANIWNLQLAYYEDLNLQQRQAVCNVRASGFQQRVTSMICHASEPVWLKCSAWLFLSLLCKTESIWQMVTCFFRDIMPGSWNKLLIALRYLCYKFCSREYRVGFKPSKKTNSGRQNWCVTTDAYVSSSTSDVCNGYLNIWSKSFNCITWILSGVFLPLILYEVFEVVLLCLSCNMFLWNVYNFITNLWQTKVRW